MTTGQCQQLTDIKTSVEGVTASHVALQTKVDALACSNAPSCANRVKG
jgi:hypothetical protein